MAQTYSIEFKEEACKRVQSGISGCTGSKGTGINANTYTHGCPGLKNIRHSPL